MRNLKWTVLIIGLVMSAVAQADDATPASALEQALAMMKKMATDLGAAKADGISLFFGSTKLNGNYQIVDAIQAKHGCVATFFARKNDGFIRVSTNVQKEGNRAVGTRLDPTGPAFAAVSKGETYQGEAKILGVDYRAIYEPIKGSDGQVIGIYFVGMPK
jgi:hypothetical protein